MIIELKDNSEVGFTARHPSYGLAEFAFCPEWKRGKLIGFHIIPMNQVNAGSDTYHVTCNADSFAVLSWEHKGIARPWCWLHFWCEEHKTQSQRVYVPDNSNCFVVFILNP